jgi:hypothetical protein
MAATALLAGIALAVVGMMLVIAGVLAAGLFLPGVGLLIAAFVAFAAAALLPLVRPDGGAARVR